VTSAAGPEGCPADGLPELALVGRSNVGKSTLVNALMRVRLARTSAAPGKTRSQPVEYLVKRLAISGGEFRFEDRRQQVFAVVPIGSIQVTGDPLTRKHHAEVRTPEGGRNTALSEMPRRSGWTVIKWFSTW